MIPQPGMPPAPGPIAPRIPRPSLTFARGNVRITVKKRDDEWIAAVYINGKYSEDMTYYAGSEPDSKDDAIATAKHMLMSMNESKRVVTQDVEVVLDGQKYLLEAGDQVIIDGKVD